MNNVVKTGLLRFVFTVIAIGLFGISTVSMVMMSSRKKTNKERTVTPKEVLLLALHLKTVVKNVLLGIQDVDKSRISELK